jgi:hypothetical protein
MDPYVMVRGIPCMLRDSEKNVKPLTNDLIYFARNVSIRFGKQSAWFILAINSIYHLWRVEYDQFPYLNILVSKIMFSSYDIPELDEPHDNQMECFHNFIMTVNLTYDFLKSYIIVNSAEDIRRGQDIVDKSKEKRATTVSIGCNYWSLNYCILNDTTHDSILRHFSDKDGNLLFHKVVTFYVRTHKTEIYKHVPTAEVFVYIFDDEFFDNERLYEQKTPLNNGKPLSIKKSIFWFDIKSKTKQSFNRLFNIVFPFMTYILPDMLIIVAPLVGNAQLKDSLKLTKMGYDMKNVVRKRYMFQEREYDSLVFTKLEKLTMRINSNPSTVTNSTNLQVTNTSV